MMLEISIAESITVRLDDDMDEQRLTPEQAEDYLTRMSRTALKMYAELDAAEAAAEDVEGTP